jgi:hypothetical protein
MCQRLQLMCELGSAPWLVVCLSKVPKVFGTWPKEFLVQLDVLEDTYTFCLQVSPKKFTPPIVLPS